MAERYKADETMRITIPTEGFGGDRSPSADKPAEPSRQDTIHQKLSEGEYSLYSQFMNSIYDAVLITDWAGNILDANSRAAEFFRCGIPDLQKSNIFEFFYGFDNLMLDRIRRNLNKGGRFVLIEAYCCRRDSTIFPSEIASNSLKLGKDNVVCFFVRDITKRKEAEKALLATQEQLAQSERLETAGRVAGLIAHDFNNLLTPLLGYPSLIKEELPPDSQARKDLDIIASTAQRMADINKQLLMLSRRGRCEKQVLDFNAVIRHLFDLVRRDSKDKIEVKLDLAEDLFNIRGAEEQILRVIQNLYQNAVDAMGESGRITIATSNVYIEQDRGGKPLEKGEYVKFTISDTGHGIPAEIQDKIFEPFFSTHQHAAKRRGAGLGMSVVYGIVEDHNGRIEIESEVGRGTTFTILLPAERRPIDLKASENLLANGTETIVITDDDEIQVEVLKKIIERLGYVVLTAKSGEDTVAIFEKCKKDGPLPDLVILDIVMAHGMDGVETFQCLMELNPEQKAIFVSGREVLTRVQEAQAVGGGAFLSKPVSAEELGAAIRKELDGR